MLYDTMKGSIRNEKGIELNERRKFKTQNVRGLFSNLFINIGSVQL